MSWRDSVPESYKDVIENVYAGVLPVGYVDDEGKLHRTVYFRPSGIIGEDEHAMADPKVKNNGPKAMTALFSVGLVEKIGDIDLVELNERTKGRGTLEILRKLTNADRDYMLLRAYEITFGSDHINFDHDCPACKETNDVSVSLDEIKVKYLDEDKTERDSFGFVVKSYKLNKGVPNGEGKLQTDVRYRLPIGLDAERLAPIARRNMAEANTSLMNMVIERIGDISPVTPTLVAKMSIKERQDFIQHLHENSPGPDLTVNFECAGCGRQSETVIPANAFLVERQ